jgi:hypothetical protein
MIGKKMKLLFNVVCSGSDNLVHFSIQGLVEAI